MTKGTLYDNSCLEGWRAAACKGPIPPIHFIIKRRPAVVELDGRLLGMMLLDCIIFLVLAWYFAQVVPWSEFGKPRPWYFPLLPSTYMGCRR